MFAILRYLISQGFRFSANGGKLRCEYVGDGDPPPEALAMLEQVRQGKDVALFFLRYLCADCGGIVFWQDWDGHRHCLSCEPIDPDVVDRLPTKARPRTPAPASGMLSPTHKPRFVLGKL